MAKGRKKGTPKTGGRQKGVPNKVTPDARTWAQGLLERPKFRAKLERDWDRLKVSPRIIEMVCGYAYGKPTQAVEVSGQVSWLDLLPPPTDEDRRAAAKVASGADVGRAPRTK